LTDNTLLPIAVRPLPNGAMLYHILNRSALTRIQAVIHTGSIHETTDCGCGLSHFLEHMLFQGCKRYPGNLASDTIHSLGGDCNAYTSFDHTAYYAEVPAAQFATAADIICSMIAEPLFPEEKFISEKEVIAREADMIFDRPAYRLIQQLWQGLYPTHPARLPIVGFPDKIAAVTREKMVNYYLRRYGAMRCHILVTGDLDTDMVQAVLAEKLADFARGNLNEPVLPSEAEPAFESIYTDEFTDPLTRIALGIRAPHPSDPRTPALDLLAGILGGNDSSLLPREFLYNRELALAIDSEFDITSFGGVMAVTAVCEPTKAEALQQGIRSSLALMRKRGVTAGELAQEKLQQRITMLQQLKHSGSMVNIVNSLKMNFNHPECLEQYLEKIDSVTLEEVNEAAKEYFDPRRFVWSIIRQPAEKKSGVSVSINPAPEVLSGKLSDGTGYVMIERNNIPLDSLSLLLPAGPVWESTVHHGISHLLAKILATGPDDMPEEEFYAELDRQGIDLDVNCGNNTLSLEMSFPESIRSVAAGILIRLLTNPRRDAEVFKRVKNNLIEQLNSKLMETNFVALKQAKRQIFGDHPAGNSRLDTPEELSAITLDELYGFYFSRFDRSLANLGTSVKQGNKADRQAALESLENISQKLPWSAEKLVKPAAVTAEELQKCANENIIRINLPREQAAAVCAVAGGFAHTREYYSLLIMDAALNGLASNLFKEVREKRSLAYSTGVAVNCGIIQGIVALHAGVKPENAEKAIECMLAEIDRLAHSGLTAEEFTSAKLSAISAMARQLESVDAKLMHAQLALFYGDDPDKSLTGAQLLNSITCEECNEVLNKIFTSSPVAKVVAGMIK